MENLGPEWFLGSILVGVGQWLIHWQARRTMDSLAKPPPEKEKDGRSKAATVERPVAKPERDDAEHKFSSMDDWML